MVNTNGKRKNSLLMQSHDSGHSARSLEIGMAWTLLRMFLMKQFNIVSIQRTKIALGQQLDTGRAKQLCLIHKKKYHGRKIARAIATKRGANHVVLKSRLPLLRKHRLLVLRSIRETQDRFQIRLRALAVMDTHIHLLVRVSDRVQFANALRMLAGTIARRIHKKGKFWLQRAWSRVIFPGRDLDTATMYVLKNPRKAGIDSMLDTFWLRSGVLQL